MPDLKGFKKAANVPVYLPENLWDYIDGAADTYLAYGFVDLHVAEYKKGKNVIKLEIYKQADNTMAFGIYSTERSSTFQFLKLGSQGYIADGAINFFKGNYYVKIRTYSKNEKTLQSAKSLAFNIANILSGTSEMPSELSLFPVNGKKINEETYINESVLGHRFLTRPIKLPMNRGMITFPFLLWKKTVRKRHGNQLTLFSLQLEQKFWIQSLENICSKMGLTEQFFSHGRRPGSLLFQDYLKINPI